MTVAAVRFAAIAVAVVAITMRRVLAISQRSCWPPPRDAVTSAGAKHATAAFAARAGTSRCG
jgi:hypothetical protein